jgi:AbrB family looped-hinge helix DNA binding protein
MESTMSKTTDAATVTIENGAVVIPPDLRERFGLEDGSTVSLEAGEDGIVLRPVDELPEVEVYTPERIAEFLLNNVVTEEEYAAAVAEVQSMGLDPEAIPHIRPDGTIR